MADPGVLIRQLQGALGTARKVGGVQSLTWAAGAASSNVATVTHGLTVRDTATVPARVLALVNGTGGPDLVAVQAFNIGATTFQIQGKFVAGTWAGGGSIPCAWEVSA